MPATLELSDLKAAAAKLSLTDRLELISFLDEVTPESDAAIRADQPTVLDIPTVSLGAMRAEAIGVDLLEEMLEDRR